MMKRTTLIMIALLLAIIVVVTFIVPVITKAASATPTVRSQAGTFDGTSSPTITVGGNCPPVNARLDVTGQCEGTSTNGEGCGTPVTITGNYGKFGSRSGSVTGSKYAYYCTSVTVGISNCCSKSESRCYGTITASCGCSDITNEALSMAGSGASESESYSCGITTYYTPCTKDPQVTAGTSVWKYSGLVLDTSTVSIPIGTNSNPSSSTSGYVGTKVPAGNLVLGSNSLPMSALELNKFGYTLYWTEETASGGGDADGDGYYSGQCTLGNDCDDSDPNVNPAHLEVPGNGKDDNCDGAVDVLYINSMDDITAYCPYDSDSKTYFCVSSGGWKDIVVNNAVTLPSDCPYGGRSCGDDEPDEIAGTCSPRNIVFQASNAFTATGSISTTTPGGPGGAITIEAKTITATSLNTAGSECSNDHCCCTCPECTENSGGPITLKGETVDVDSINANDGRGVHGSGGAITVVADTSATIDSISAAGAAYSCSYDYGYTNGAGSGGSVNIKSKTATLGTINLNGASGSYGDTGGSGGPLRLEIDNLHLNGAVSLNGAYRCGNGGPATVLAGTSIFTGAFTGNGASCGSNGQVRIGADSLTAGTISTTGSTGGGGTKTYLDTYAIGSLASSGYVSFVSDNMPDDQSFISAGGQKRIYGRSKTALFGFNTSIPDVSAKSFRIRLKDLGGAYFKIKIDEIESEWSETGMINPDEPGKVSSEVGRETPLAGFKGGKKYYLELTTSTDAEFDAGRCTSGAATCSSYDTGFVEWS